MVEIKEEVIQLAAHVLGPSSASAKALQNAEARRAAGEAVRFYQAPNGTLLVEGTARQTDGGAPNVG